MAITTHHAVEGERRNIARVHLHLQCIAAAATDRAAIPALEDLLAPDFQWATPSSDPLRRNSRGRNEYLALFNSEPGMVHPAQLVSLQLHLDRVMAEGDWVAAETHSSGLRADGLPYNNFYHQAWRFDHAGRIAEYRIYSDTATLDELETTSKSQSAVSLVCSLLVADEPCGSDCLVSQAAQWICVLPRGNTVRVSLAALRSQQAVGLALSANGSFRIDHERTVASRRAVLLEGASGHWEDSNSTVSTHLLVCEFDDYAICSVREYSIGEPLLQATSE